MLKKRHGRYLLGFVLLFAIGIYLKPRISGGSEHWDAQLSSSAPVFDPSAVDLIVHNYFIHHRARIVWELNNDAFSSTGPVIENINKAAGARLTVKELRFNSSVPRLDVKSLKLSRQKLKKNILVVDAELHLQSKLTFELDGIRHSGITTTRELEGNESVVIKAAEKTARAMLKQWEGDRDYDVRFLISGRVQGKARLKLLLRAAPTDEIPQVVHATLQDFDSLHVVLDDYELYHHHGFARWIKRLHLVPLSIIERLTNGALQGFLEENRHGWPIKPPDDGKAAEKKAELELAQAAEDLGTELRRVNDDRKVLEDQVMALEKQLADAKAGRERQEPAPPDEGSGDKEGKASKVPSPGATGESGQDNGKGIFGLWNKQWQRMQNGHGQHKKSGHGFNFPKLPKFHSPKLDVKLPKVKLPRLPKLPPNPVVGFMKDRLSALAGARREVERQVKRVQRLKTVVDTLESKLEESRRQAAAAEAEVRSLHRQLAKASEGATKVGDSAHRRKGNAGATKMEDSAGDAASKHKRNRLERLIPFRKPEPGGDGQDGLAQPSGEEKKRPRWRPPWESKMDGQDGPAPPSGEEKKRRRWRPPWENKMDKLEAKDAAEALAKRFAAAEAMAKQLEELRGARAALLVELAEMRKLTARLRKSLDG